MCLTKSFNDMKGKTTFLAKAFLMLFAVLFSITGARAQKALPYEYGFENNDLAAEGWMIVGGTSSTGIKPAAKQNGSYGFQFFYNTTPPQILISPELTGTENGVKVTFSYKNASTYDESFKVGYSTTTNDYEAFAWEEEVDASSTTEWTLYETTFPAGTKYVAVAYTANNQFKMYVDDFSFIAPGSSVIIKPTKLTISYEGGTEATVSWVSDASAFDIDVNDVVTENVSNPYSMKDLSLGTTYTIKVRAKEGNDVSVWSDPVSFTTDYPVQTLPYEDSFENGIGPWKLVDCNSGSGIVNTARTGNSCFGFKYNTTPPQYLISPEFEGTSALSVSFWYKVQGSSYLETFQVGYSTTTMDVNEFTWDEEVETNSTSWLEYEVNYPVGTKYVAVRYNSNDKYYLFVDDFSFTVDNGVAKPTDLAVSEVGAKSALLSWTENGKATAWEICLNGDEENLIAADSNPFTLTGLTPETDYTVKVRAVNGEKSKWSTEVAFTTDEEFPNPKELAAVPTAKTATVSWTGKADSYTLQYRSYSKETVFFSDDFENGMDKWTIYTEGEASNADGWTAYQTTPSVGLEFAAHSGEYVASAWSWASNAYNANNWLVTPQVALGGKLSFWVRTNAGYPDQYEVLLSTTGNAVEDFTETLQAMDKAPAEAAWNQVVIDLSEYAGQEGYIAIHHQDYDANYLLIDDFSVTDVPKYDEWNTVYDATSPYTIEGLLPETNYQVQVQAIYEGGKSEWVSTSFTTREETPAPTDLAVSNITWATADLSWTENGEATSWVVNVYDNTEDDSFGEFTTSENPYTITGLNPETEYMVAVRPAGNNSKWSASIIFTSGIRFKLPTDLAVGNITTTSAEVSWTDDAEATGAVLEYADATDASLKFTEYKYDNGTFATSIGLGGDPFYWGVMFPAGSYTGSYLSKVSVYDSKEMTGSVTIYNSGDTAPENAIATAPVTFTGAGKFIDIAINATIDASKNVWVIFYNESGTDFPASCSNDELNDPNGRWVEIDGSWYDLAGAGISGRCFMIRAEFGSANVNSLNNWTTVADATSPYELTDLNPETTYAVRVKSIYAEGESKFASTFFTTESANPVPSDIALDLAADGATFTWEGLGDSYNVRYRTAESAGEAIFEDNFDNGLDKWTTVTAGEGPGWVIGTETGGNAATAYSWNGGVSYNADNWLISPAVELDGVLTFTVTTANSYPDSYEVLLSTTGTELEDFTITLQAMAAAVSGDVTIDLSAYAGQTGYIAFHHVSSDCYLLVIDDFSVHAPNVPAGEWQDMAVADKTATISGLATNKLYEYQIQSVKNEKASEWSKLADFALLTLDSDVDNTKVINQYKGKFAHVTLSGRTFFKDNTWNTIYLPFDMTLDEVAASPLADADVRTLTNNITVEDKTVTLNFTAEGEALTTWGGNKFFGGVPYIAKWTEGSDIVNPEFANVTITNARYYVGDNTKVAFAGTYAPISYNAEDTSILFIGEDNKLNWPLAGAKIGAFRGFFQLYGMTAEYNASGAKQFVTNLDGEDPTSIANISNVKDNNEWYDLSGRKLAGKPNTKGIFVTGGRKVTIK